MTAGGVGDRGQQQRHGAAVQACGELAVVDRVALGDARGSAQHPRFRPAAAGAARVADDQLWSQLPNDHAMRTLYAGHLYDVHGIESRQDLEAFAQESTQANEAR